jgi:hypothetical protein
MGVGPRRRVPNPAPHVVGEVPLLGPTLHDSDPTPKANRLGDETTTRQPTLPDAALGSTDAWNFDSDGCRTRRRVPNPAPHVVGEVPLLGPTLIPSSTLSG